MTLTEVINYRRSVRNYKNIPIDTEKVKHCIALATLAPNSSNMQLWEFYHITTPEILKQLAVACLSQASATTAQQMVIFVTRQDFYPKRAKEMMDLEMQNVQKNSPKERTFIKPVLWLHKYLCWQWRMKNMTLAPWKGLIAEE